MLLHEPTGAMSDFTAKLLHRAKKNADKNGCDGTMYQTGSTASSFVPYYAQRLSWAAIKGTAITINTEIAKKCRDRLRQ